MKKFNLLFVIFISLPASFANSTSMSEARKSALDFGNVYKNSAGTIINEDNKKNTPGYTTDNPDQTKYYSGSDMSGDINNKIANSDEGKLFTQGLPNRPKVEVSLDDPFLNSAGQIEQNPDEVIAMFTGTYGQCTPVEVTVTDVETRTCDFYEERDGGSCLVDQVVEVEASHDYQCNKTRNSQDKVCNKTLGLTCLAFNNDCSTAQIFSITDGNGIYSYPNLNVGIPWSGGGCSLYTKTMNFTIYDVSQITQFTFTHISYDDYASVKINGHYLFNNIPSSYDWCERGTVFNSNFNTDVKPYLINGNNQIEVRALVSGLGFASADFVVKQRCCSNWQENWEEVCP